MSSNPTKKNVSWFERTIVFRIARTLYSASAGIAFLTLVVSLLVILYSITPTLRGFEPSEPNKDGDPNVTEEEVLARLSPAKTPTPEVQDREAPSEIEPELEDNSQIDALLQQIAKFFTEDTHPWQDQTRGYCANRDWYGDCIQWRKETIAPGAYSILVDTISSQSKRAKIAHLKNVLKAMPLLLDQDYRYIYTGMARDVYQSFPSEHIQVLAEVLYTLGHPQPAASEGQQNPVFTPLTDEGKLSLLMTMLYLEKSGRSSDKLVGFMPRVSEIISLISEDARFAVAAIWEVSHFCPEDRIETHIANSVAIIAKVKEEQRVQAAILYQRIYDEKRVSVDAKYGSEMSEYQLRLNEIEADYLASKAQKTSVRGMAFLGALYALGAIAAVGLLLGLLAIERNTRKMEQLLIRLDGGSDLGALSESKPEVEAVSEEAVLQESDGAEVVGEEVQDGPQDLVMAADSEASDDSSASVESETLHADSSGEAPVESAQDMEAAAQYAKSLAEAALKASGNQEEVPSDEKEGDDEDTDPGIG
jgi:hypothetical protein